MTAPDVTTAAPAQPFNSRRPEMAENKHTDETAGDMLERLGMDGVKWADEFLVTAERLGYSTMDSGWLVGWFSNAIMAGYDHARRKYDPECIAARATQPGEV